VSASKPIWILTLGPLLDSPDDFRMVSFRHDGGKIAIDVAHTSARLKGSPLRRNWPYRPLLLIPLESGSTAGAHQLEVSWLPVDSLPDGAPLGPALHLPLVSFEVIK